MAWQREESVSLTACEKEEEEGRTTAVCCDSGLSGMGREDGDAAS